MTLDPELRALLVCPRCRGELRDAPDALDCETCRVSWPVVDDVPYLVDECARPLDRDGDPPA